MMVTVSNSPADVHYSAAVASAWLLGNAMGRHTEVSVPPAGYSPAESAAYRDGWAAGERNRRPAMGEPDAPLPSAAHDLDDEAEYAVTAHGDDHDGAFDPEAIELWAQASGDYHDAERDRGEPADEAEVNWALARRVAVGVGSEVAA